MTFALDDVLLPAVMPVRPASDAAKVKAETSHIIWLCESTDRLKSLSKT